jgi:hypothetical protein
MTEAEWLGSVLPDRMRDFMEGKATDRKLRLFGVACFRRGYCRLFGVGQEGQDAVAVAERYADGLASREDVDEAGRRVLRWDLHSLAADMERLDVHQQVHYVFASNLLRDLFGPLLFRPVTADPAWLSWRDGTVPRLAQVAYDQRSLPSGYLNRARLAVLADALEEAGCSVTEILDHLRGLDPHVRGCWVVDLLLGKS